MIQAVRELSRHAKIDESIPGRKEKRYLAAAQVQMEQSVLLLKDVSLNGGCIRSGEFLELIPNNTYTITIFPEEESRIDAFEVDIISRWIRMNRSGLEAGFIIVLLPGSKVADYIEYLKSKPLK